MSKCGDLMGWLTIMHGKHSSEIGSHRRVWRIAWPLILSNISVPLLGAVDTAVMGHLGEPYYIGAVGVGAIVFNYLYWGFGFLRMGTGAFAAQAMGMGDANEVRAVLARALIVGCGFAGVILVLQAPVISITLGLLDASEEVERLTEVYYGIRVWSAPAALTNYVILGLLLGTQRAGLALALQCILNGLNIVLDIGFVLGFGWGVEGVAAATLISEYVAALIGIWIAFRVLRRVGGSWKRQSIFRSGWMAPIIRVNFDIYIRTLCLLTVFAIFTSEGAKFGDVILAANILLLHFQSFMAYGLDGFADAAQTLVGSAVGSRNRKALRAVVRSSTLLALAVALMFTVIYAAAGTLLIKTLTSIPEVRSAARHFMPWAIASPLISVWSYLLDGIFIGATRTGDMRNGMIISLVLFLGLLWLLVPVYGNSGLWFSFLIFMAARGVTLGVRYRELERSIDDEKIK